jgi:hypothetical protein
MPRPGGGTVKLDEGFCFFAAGALARDSSQKKACSFFTLTP